MRQILDTDRWITEYPVNLVCHTRCERNSQLAYRSIQHDALVQKHATGQKETRDRAEQLAHFQRCIFFRQQVPKQTATVQRNDQTNYRNHTPCVLSCLMQQMSAQKSIKVCVCRGVGGQSLLYKFYIGSSACAGGWEVSHYYINVTQVSVCGGGGGVYCLVLSLLLMVFCLGIVSF